jgi:hypothetical protein
VLPALTLGCTVASMTDVAPSVVAARSRPALAALGPVVAAALAAAAAAISGFLTYAALAAGDQGDDPWQELGWVIAALAVAGLAGACVYVVGLVVAARRLLPRGRRAVPAVVAAFAPLPAVVSIGALSDPPFVAGAEGVAVAGAAAWTVLSMGAGPAAFAWAASRPGETLRHVLVPLGAVLALVGSVCVAVAFGWSAVEHRRVQDQLPLVLFWSSTSEPSVHPPFPGWRHDNLSRVSVRPASWITSSRHDAYLKYFADGDVRFVTMHTDIGDCSPGTADGYRCEVLGSGPEGELRRYQAVGGFAGRDDHWVASVYLDGSAVAVNVGEYAGEDEAVGVLRALVRVDRDQFEDAAGPLSP